MHNLVCMPVLMPVTFLKDTIKKILCNNVSIKIGITKIKSQKVIVTYIHFQKSWKINILFVYNSIFRKNGMAKQVTKVLFHILFIFVFSKIANYFHMEILFLYH